MYKQYNDEDLTGLDTVLKRLIGVLDYIAEVERVGKKVPFRVADHDRAVFFEHELDTLPGVRFNVDEENQIWLQIERLQPVSPPLP